MVAILEIINQLIKDMFRRIVKGIIKIMFKEKIITKTIFNPDIFKEGIKVRAKCRPLIDDDYEYWEVDFIGTVKYCYEDVICLEDPDDRDYDIFSDESHSRQYRVFIEEVKMGFWLLELL